MTTGNAEFREEGYFWTTPQLDADARASLAKENQASLDRKITYCLNRPHKPVQFQRVQGWSTGRILGYMHGRGMKLDTLLKELASTSRSQFER